jgi:hypothetical protein
VHLRGCVIERLKETEPLDVVHVQVREENVEARPRRAMRRAQATNPRPGIKDQHRTI